VVLTKTELGEGEEGRGRKREVLKSGPASRVNGVDDVDVARVVRDVVDVARVPRAV
jgi:hypothetical protein